MSWQMAVLLNIIFGTIRGYIYKKLVDKIDPFIVSFYINFFALPLYTVYYLVEGGGSFTLFPEMMVLGILFLLGFAAYLYAAKISLSKSAVYSSFSLVITLFLTSIFLSEWNLFDIRYWQGQKNIIGIILALFSMYYIYAADSKREKVKDAKWLILITVNIIIFGVGAYLSKIFLLSHTPVAALFSQTITVVPLAFFMAKIKRNNLVRIGKQNFFWLSANAIFDFLTVMFYYIALKEGPTVLVLPVINVALMVTVAAAGLLFFNEIKQFSKSKYIGLILGIIGIGLLVI